VAVSVKKPMPTDSEIAEWAVKKLAATIYLVRHDRLPPMWPTRFAREPEEPEEAPSNGAHVLLGGTSPAQLPLALQGTDAVDAPMRKR